VLHHCLVRPGISRLSRDAERASKRERLAKTRIGYVHLDIGELRLMQDKIFMFLAIDRAAKSTHVAFLDANTKAHGAAFLRQVVEVFPYRLHTVLTDHRPQRGALQADVPAIVTAYNLAKHLKALCWRTPFQTIR